MVGIYKIASPSGRVYVGQSKEIEKRIDGYKKYGAKNQTLLEHSFAKYGRENHIFEILHELPAGSSVDVLNYHECFFIHLYRILGAPTLNIREGGTNGSPSEETKKKLAITTGRWMNSLTPEEAKNRAEKISKSMKGKSTAWLTGRKLSQESIRKRIESCKGKPRSAESRIRYAISKTGDKNPMFGKLPPNTKLSAEDVINIRNTPVVRKYGHCANLARIYNVRSCTIHAILNNRLWRNIC